MIYVLLYQYRNYCTWFLSLIKDNGANKRRYVHYTEEDGRGRPEVGGSTLLTCFNSFLFRTTADIICLKNILS